MEGRVGALPSYRVPCDVDEADAPGMTAAMVAANRAGIVTTSSQCGWDGPGADEF
jgi:hypothetical protein